MKIAVNTRILLKDRLEGVGWFTLETLRHITQQHKEHTFLFFFDRPYDDAFVFGSNIEPIVMGPQARHPFLFYIWFEFAVAHALKSTKADLFLSPDGFLSLRSNVPQVSVIHDLNFEHRPQDIPWLPRHYYHYFFPKFARKATRIATVSGFSKKDIIRCYDIPAEKIDVVYNGANAFYGPVDVATKETARQQFAEGHPYFLFIGAFLPRKNIARLLSAFDAFKRSESHPHKLLLVGQKKWWTDEMDDAFNRMQYRNDVVFLGRRQPEELKNIIGGAEAMTYVPLFEGFGIPILEGMQSGIPVICADTSSMPEVAGDACEIVDPYSIESIAAAMRKVAGDENLRREMIRKGLKQAENFSWQKTGERLWASMERALGHP